MCSALPQVRETWQADNGPGMTLYFLYEDTGLP